MTERGPAARLLDAAAVRERCAELLALAEDDGLDHFTLRAERLPAVAERVAAVTRAAYPSLAIPYHGRWRHFEVDGVDRAAALRAAWPGADPREVARTEIELAVTSVLLDAGAGPRWRYRDRASGREVGRSEGLALASLGWLASGSAWRRAAGAPPALDAAALAQMPAAELADAFQVREDNPLTGLDGRVALLRALGRRVVSSPGRFADGRLGALLEPLVAGGERTVRAADVLIAVLESLGPIWPGRLVVDGVPLGDAWRHSRVARDDATDCVVPFHKLSQWLTYSLVEPLERSGVSVVGLDDLTGLAEYRNGGLFVDGGVIAPRDPGLAGRRLEVGDEPVVEWRALTVALLDRVAPLVRERLGLSPAALPLARVLEGGTWRAGRCYAAERRDGAPPFRIASDGTVF